MTDLPFGEPLTPPSGAAATVKARCSHPRQFRQTRTVEVGGGVDVAPVVVTVQSCGRCGKYLDPAKQRAGRRNRARGGAAELDVARRMSGRKVGPLGGPEDVTIAGYMRLQVKKLASWPSLAKAVTWMDAMAPGDDMRGVAIVEAAGMGVKPRRLLVLDLDEYAKWHGDPTKGEQA